MKYRYRILWVEDEIEAQKELHEAELKNHLESHGFELEIAWVDQKPKKSDYSKFDLIITDLNFADPGDKQDSAGIEILQHVRDCKITTDVLIYSGSPALLEKAIKDMGFIERVSVNYGHEGLLEKIKRLVDLTIKKVQTVENIRGLVIAETIYIETQLAEIARNYLVRADKDRRDQKVGRATSVLQKKIQFVEKSLTKLKAVNPDRLDIFCENTRLTTFDFAMLLTGIIEDIVKVRKEASAASGTKDTSIEELLAIARDIKKLDDEVLGVRNTLAHVHEEQKDGLPILKARSKAGKPITINHDWCVKMRRTIRAHSKGLLRLPALV